MVERLRKLFGVEEGATAVEYGIMVALIAVVIIAAVALLGNNINEQFQCTAESVAAGSDECPGDGGDEGGDEV